MSMLKCKCGTIYDTDYQMEVDENGNCICAYNKLYGYIQLIVRFTLQVLGLVYMYGNGNKG